MMLPAQDHSKTSIEAAESMEPHAPTLRERVYNLLKSQLINGMTDEEMQDTLLMNPSTQRPRRIELLNQGVIEDSGVKRLTKSGRKAVVWRAVRIFGIQKDLFG